MIFAVLIGLGSLQYTNKLVKDLKIEERKKAEQLAEATRRLIEDEAGQENLEFLFSVIDRNKTVPVILVDENEKILSFHNFDTTRIKDEEYLPNQLKRIKAKSEPIIINYNDGARQFIYYKDSIILTRLIYYPYIQLAVIIMFILISYFAFSMSRKAEQNQVWVGLSKETAHQLGTPTSSLSGWAELIKNELPDSNIPEELARDVSRLEKITDRFSKIGSRPELGLEDINAIIINSFEYLRSRTSSKVDLKVESMINPGITIPLNSSLFEWVIENLCKNSVDAMNGEGQIIIKLVQHNDNIILDVEDTGKGIPKAAHKNIFKPGYTTKERGWGLGLSLSRRIIEIYHGGKIFVKRSESGKGTTIRMVLKAK